MRVTFPPPPPPSPWPLLYQFGTLLLMAVLFVSAPAVFGKISRAPLTHVPGVRRHRKARMRSDGGWRRGHVRRRRRRRREESGTNGSGNSIWHSNQGCIHCFESRDRSILLCKKLLESLGVASFASRRLQNKKKTGGWWAQATLGGTRARA
jgi:hypothetical protein